MKKLLCVILAAAMLLCIPVSANAEDGKALSFGDDGKFVILHISDPQDDRYAAYDLINFMKLSIEKTNPDLVVLSGDIVEDSRVGDVGIDDESGREGVTVDNDYAATLENTKIATDNILSIINDAQIPFAVSQGNNDYASGVTNEDWLKIYSSYEYSLVKDESADSTGRIDYNVEILGADGKAAFNIWLMDTGKNNVNEEQIAWYEAESDALKTANGGKALPSFVFQHIPVSDMGNLFEECNFWDEGAVSEGGKYYRLNHELANGYNVGAMVPGETTEQFKSWKKQGDVLGAYFGHWHTEGYTGVWDGIELGFTYGCEFAKPDPYGIRVFTLYEDDIENYDNEIYTYEGSVKKGDARFELQVDTEYAVYNNFIEEFFAAIRNVFALIAKEIKSLLS
ncbi:MAG: metallophosphoesterase [Clostridia bacterium]|nr:metallophosphoesterase [Clostridia bacterium]